MNEWMSLTAAAEFLGVHFHTVRRLARNGHLEERRIPWKGSATRYVIEYSRASVERQRTAQDAQPAPPDPAEWMPIAEAQTALKMTRHGIKRRIRMGLLNALHQGVVGGVSLYVSRKQVKEHATKPPAYQRRTAYELDADEVEVIKLAGFFDGEGCVQISHATRGHQQWGLKIQITNTYRPRIVEIHQRFGGRLYSKSHQPTTRKDCYVWTATGDEARAILKKMRPYLAIKHHQADLGIEFQDHIRSQRWTRWDRLPPEEIEWRNEIRKRLQALNHENFPALSPE